MTATEDPTGEAIPWDGALIERARRGDPRAFERLYREHSPRVYGLCLRLTRDHAQAEDCVQETFINAWRGLAKFETRSSLATWLHRIAVNVVLGRRRRVTPPTESLDENSDRFDHEFTFETPVEVEEIENAIHGLPEGARDVLVLCGLYGYSHGEAASMLGVAEGTCKAQLHTGKPGRSEFRCTAPGGRIFHYDHRAVPVLDEGRVRTITVAVTDVTERVLAQQAIMNDVKERKRLEREIIEIANREQQRIGSDLHDGLGQDLTGIALMLRGIVAQLRKEGSTTRLDVEDVINLVNNAIESTRALARGLSPVSAEQGGLAAALQALAARSGERYGLRIQVRTDLARPLQLDETTATHLYRIGQEALTNVVRHSRATAVTIDLRLAHELLELAIGDNGRGFTATDEANGLGLKIMRYRAQMLGGDLLLESQPEGGALVRCVCPMPPPKVDASTGRHRRVPS